MWSEKYRPSRIEEMIGNEQSRLGLLRWLRSWKRGSRQALMVGPPGTGKTTTARLLAKKFSMNIVELNASDTRTKETLSQRIREVSRSASLYEERTLIFLDEIDGLVPRQDYGAIDFIKELIKETYNPVILAANDEESEQVRKIRELCTVFRFRPVPPREIEFYLREISRKEGIQAEQRIFEIVKSCNGDVRFAINMLQSTGSSAKNVEVSSGGSINMFFSSEDSAQALESLSLYPGEPREKIRDIFVSLLNSQISMQEKKNALEIVSQADILVGRIYKARDWRLLRYLDKILATRLFPLIKGKKISYSREYLPWKLQVRVWNDSRKILELNQALSRFLFTSKKKVSEGCLPFLQYIAEKNEVREFLRKLGVELSRSEYE